MVSNRGIDCAHYSPLTKGITAVVPSVAVVGATGAVGEVMRQILIERKFPLRSIKFLASERSAGKTVEFQGKAIPVEALRPEAFAGIDIVLSSTPASISREFSPIAARAGAIVIDNSSAWRMDPDVPLVVPEVNADALKKIPKGIVANLELLHHSNGGRACRSTILPDQTGGGSHPPGVIRQCPRTFRTDAQVKALGRGEKVPPITAHAAQLAGNVLPHDWKAGDDGYSEEEWKMIRETRKIMGDDTIQVSPTTARVPVRIGHSEAINLEFERPITVEQAREALRRAPGIILVDDPANGAAPLALDAAGREEVFVGRVRLDPAGPHRLNIWPSPITSAVRATNAVQIAEVLVQRGWLPRSKDRG